MIKGKQAIYESVFAENYPIHLVRSTFRQRFMASSEHIDVTG